MSFRFLFFGNSSQNDTLTDLYTRQAEAEFRSLHKVDFNEYSQPVSQTPSVSAETSNQNQISGLNNVANVVTELVQTVTKNADTDPQAVIETSNNLAKLNTTVADVIKVASDKLTPSSEPAKTETVATLKTIAETIQTVSQTLNTDNARTISESLRQNSVPQNEPVPNKYLEELVNKMNSYLETFKSTFISFLQVLQKPQLESYYSAQDSMQDFSDKQEIDLKDTKKRQAIEDKVIQKVMESEDNKKIIKKQIKEETESSEQLIEKAKKSELDRMLERKLEEIRKNPLFEK
jgi:hypothetical protein